MLSSPRARASGAAFAAGWLLGLGAVMLVVLALTDGGDDPDSGTETAVDLLRIAAGVAFLLLALKGWRGRPRAGEPVATPAWMATLDSVTPARGVVLGLTLSAANPKNLVLTASAASAITQVGLDGGEAALAGAAFVVIASVAVVGLVLAHLVAADRVAGPLASIKDFMLANNTVIMMVILLVMGGKILGDGLAGLAA